MICQYWNRKEVPVPRTGVFFSKIKTQMSPVRPITGTGSPIAPFFEKPKCAIWALKASWSYELLQPLFVWINTHACLHNWLLHLKIKVEFTFFEKGLMFELCWYFYYQHRWESKMEGLLNELHPATTFDYSSNLSIIGNFFFISQSHEVAKTTFSPALQKQE